MIISILPTTKMSCTLKHFRSRVLAQVEELCLLAKLWLIHRSGYKTHMVKLCDVHRLRVSMGVALAIAQNVVRMSVKWCDLTPCDKIVLALLKQGHLPVMSKALDFSRAAGFNAAPRKFVNCCEILRHCGNRCEPQNTAENRLS